MKTCENENKNKAYPAITAPIGIEMGIVGVMAGLTITVPSTNGANPGKNLFYFLNEILKKVTLKKLCLKQHV